tara:strand:+ start:1164 stop:1613 length:450 start_codon:yes stop_codon:yes gene_type:complete
MLAPASNQDFGLPQRVKYFAIEKFVPELAVEALVVAIFPRAARFDVERLHANPAEPVAHGMGGKLRAIIRSYMCWRTMTLEQIGQYRQHIVALELSLDMDRQALPAVFIDHRQHPERLAVMGAVGDEVVAPDMATILGSEPHARAIVQP